jgi:metallo-beta-lactamase family protein
VKASKTIAQFFIFVVLTGVFAFHGFPSWQVFFYGAVGGEVAGSCYYLTNGTDAILIDCGSHFSEEVENEGERKVVGPRTDPCTTDADRFPFDGTKVRAILITHAHADHIGRLHWFILQYPDFTGPIYMTPATWEIYSATLDDTIQYADCFPGCLKTTVKERIKNQKEVVFPLVTFSLVEGVSAYFVENGHIPGSVSVIINIVERNEVTTICFSGDIGPGNHPFLKDIPYDVFSMTQADILVVESTYGDKSRDNVETVEEFYQVIRESVKNKKLVIIPTFALDRTQRILALLAEGIRDGKIPATTKIAVGGKSSRSITEKYVEMMNCKDCERMGFSTKFCTEKPLNEFCMEEFQDARCTWVRFSETNIAEAKNYDVIVTPSGTGESSDSQKLLKAYVGDPNVVIVQVGWAPGDSPMGQLGAGKRIVEIEEENNGQKVKYTWRVNCIFYSFHDIFSGHADQRGLLRFVQTFKNRDTVIITHGNEGCRDALEKAINEKIPGLKIFKPNYGWGFDIKTRSPIPPKESYQTEPQVVIAAVLPNPRGLEPDNEWVELMNIGPERVNLKGWYICDNVGIYVIDRDIYLEPHQSIKIYGREYNPIRDKKGVWLANDRDCVHLFKPTGEEVSRCCWKRRLDPDEVLPCGR